MPQVYQFVACDDHIGIPSTDCVYCREATLKHERDCLFHMLRDAHNLGWPAVHDRWQAYCREAYEAAKLGEYVP